MRDVKIPNWLTGLPLAPEFRPTDTEFADPIAYISKIEKEASAFGICKVIPPLPKPSKKFVFSNLNKSLSKCPELGSDVDLSNVCGKKNGDKRSNAGEVKAVFTTRQQELGQSGKRKKNDQKQSQPIYKQVWQSGEVYTLEQFESKSKIFARSQLGMVKQVSAPVVETLFWEAASEKPIYVEYANDVPGSGFGEPDGSTFRRIRRTPNRNNKEDCQSNNNISVAITSNDESRGASNKFNPSSVGTMSNISPDYNSQVSSEKSSGHRNEIEGTSGQKLSNSPWNLQVIARSPGSLTRFMPDDIPGVTSPMVYIGMLFSWFAWHVEDHELHSLNFLHTGSSKTWYAVPADYALTFEEVIRNQAYGGNIDHLAALTLLGEKTTLLSPEVIVASGIPCCRLVQNPGEFVVTFPRAYHVGFSHGFNCGEAANFGTPKWLTVAKEAAVRRAVMNHLPMLSHQQLLYLLTMSFIPRVPRYLLPGVRGSRLRDRQKEERELSVKKAFVEDILTENCKLTKLLQKNSSYRVVQWDLESLPSSSKGSDLVNCITTTIEPKKNLSTENAHKHELLNHSWYMEYVGDFHVDDADLSSEFQTDSGALPCVACGLLGFPFMSVVQPSKEASGDILSANPVESNSSLYLNGMVDVSVSDAMNGQDILIKERISTVCERNDTATTKILAGREINMTEKCAQTSPTGAHTNLEKGKSTFCMADSQLKALPTSSAKKSIEGLNPYLRPRIFCLEHAIEVEELLRAKGGADVLVICHSDFKKIKGHIAALAEEIGKPFNYQEVIVDNASQEDLKLINSATDYEGQDECQEDWTSKVKTNLRYCLKLSKDFPSERLQHALTLKGLCFDNAPSEGSLSLKWRSRKLRSKRMKLDQAESKSSEITLITEDEGAKSDIHTGGKQAKLIHYVRRFKSKNSSSVGAGMISEDSTNISPICCANKDRHIRITDDLGTDEKTGNGSSETFVLVSREASDRQKEKCSVETRDLSEIDVSQVNTGLVTAELLIENVTSQTGNYIVKELTVNDKACDSSTSDPQMQQGIKFGMESKVSETSSGKFCETSSGSPEVANLTALACQSSGSVQVEKENQMTEATCSQNVDHDVVISSCIGEQPNIHDNGDASLKEVSDPTISEVTYADITNVERSDEQIEKPLVDSNNMNIVSDSCEKLEREVQVVCTSTSGVKEKKASVSVNFTPSERSCSITSEEIIDFPSESCAAENMDRNNLEPQPTSVVKNSRKRKREADLLAEDGSVFDGFIRSPCEGLRPRTVKDTALEQKPVTKMDRGSSEGPKKMDRDASEDTKPHKIKTENRKASHKCDVDGCKLSFKTNHELRLHKRNQCHHEGCGKKFSSHKNAVTHLRVHDDDRPLKCPWKDCNKSFKWAWARTEHIRVHTGEKPYKCKVEGCGRAFRFVSDYSRHRRKTGHCVD